MAEFWQIKTRSEPYWTTPKPERPSQAVFENPNIEVRALCDEQELREAQRVVREIADTSDPHTDSTFVDEVMQIIRDVGGESLPMPDMRKIASMLEYRSCYEADSMKLQAALLRAWLADGFKAERTYTESQVAEIARGVWKAARAKA